MVSKKTNSKSEYQKYLEKLGVVFHLEIERGSWGEKVGNLGKDEESFWKLFLPLEFPIKDLLG